MSLDRPSEFLLASVLNVSQFTSPLLFSEYIISNLLCFDLVSTYNVLDTDDDTVPPPVAELEGRCELVGDEGYQQWFECSFNNPLNSLTCSFDGGEPETCSPILLVTIDRLGPGPHTVVMIATDENGQTISIPLEFRLTGYLTNLIKLIRQLTGLLTSKMQNLLQMQPEIWLLLV